MIIYLFIEELFIIKALCVWCTVIHLVGFALFVIDRHLVAVGAVR